MCSAPQRSYVPRQGSACRFCGVYVSLPQIVVADDGRAFCGARDSGDAFLCRFLGKVSVVGRGDDVAVGGEQTQTDFTLLVGINLPLGEFELFPLLEGLVFDGSGGGIAAYAVYARLAGGDGSVKPRAYRYDSVVGRVEFVDEIVVLRLLDDELAVRRACVALFQNLLGGFRRLGRGFCGFGFFL